MSARGEGTSFLLAPTQIASPQLASVTWTMAQRSLHHALGFQSHFHCDRLSSFWKTPPSPTGTLWVPLLPVTGTLSLYLFPPPWPLLSLAFPEAFPSTFSDFLDFSFALYCFFLCCLLDTRVEVPLSPFSVAHPAIFIPSSLLSKWRKEELPWTYLTTL